MVVSIDHERDFTRCNQLAEQVITFSEIQFLSAQTFGKLFPFFLAIVVHKRGEPIVGFVVHPELFSPPWGQQVFQRLGLFLRLDQVSIENEQLSLCEDRIEISLIIFVTRPKRVAVWRTISRNNLPFFEGKQKKSANVSDIKEVVFRAVFGIDAGHSLDGAAVQKLYSDERMFLLEKIDQLLRILPVHGRIPNKLAFLARAFEEF